MAGPRLFALGALVLLALAPGPALGEGEAQPKTLSLGEVSVAISTTSGNTVLSSQGSAPKQLLSNPQVPPLHSLEVALAGVTAGGEEFKPQQVMLQLKHKKTGVSAYFTTKAKSAPFKFSATLAAAEKQIGRLGGQYTVALLVGDPSAAAGVVYELGAAEFMLAEGQSPAAGPSVRTAQHQPLNNLKPVIQHIFRQPEKRPPSAVSLVFAGLALVPLAGVVGAALFGLNINFNAFPKSGGDRIAALAFHGVLGLMLLVYFMFWTRWNLVYTLPRVLVLGVVLAVAGHRLLSSLSAARLLKKD